MPNWCMNTLNVSGGADEIKRFVFANQGLPAKYPPQEWEKAIAQMEPQPTESYFCFNALVPTPQEVLDAAGIATVGLCGTSNETIPDAEKVLPKNLCPLIKSTYGFAYSEKCNY